MANLCFSNLFWDSKILFRPIDEAVMLAEYFIISQDTDIGKKHLKEWFRENRSPSNVICRETISNYMQKILPDFYDTYKKNLSEVYSIKSKSIHHSLNSILETYNVTIEKDNIKQVGFDFGKCTYTSKILETIEFFQSSIWTAFQGFFICFNSSMPLTKEDSDLLIFYDTKIFQN